MNLDTLHYMVCVEEISQTKPYVKKVKKKSVKCVQEIARPM